MALAKKITRNLMLAAFGVALAIPCVTLAQDTGASVNGLTGNAEAGKQDYRRWCVGCHGKEGNGEGENAQWIDPKPRDFTEALSVGGPLPLERCRPIRIYMTRSRAAWSTLSCPHGVR